MSSRIRRDNSFTIKPAEDESDIIQNADCNNSILSSSSLDHKQFDKVQILSEARDNLPFMEIESIEKSKELTKNFITKLIEKKTSHCKHSSGCAVNALKGFCKNFIFGYSFKAVIRLLFLLIKRKGISKILRALLNQDALLFGLFLGLFCGMYKSMNWFLRWVRKTEDRYNSIFSGIFSSLSATVDTADSRQTNILYALARNVEVTIKLLDRKRIVKEPKYWEIAIYTTWCVFILYWLYFEQQFAPKFARNQINQLGALKRNDIIYKDLICNMMKF